MARNANEIEFRTSKMAEVVTSGHLRKKGSCAMNDENEFQPFKMASGGYFEKKVIFLSGMTRNAKMVKSLIVSHPPSYSICTRTSYQC